MLILSMRPFPSLTLLKRIAAVIHPLLASIYHTALFRFSRICTPGDQMFCCFFVHTAGREKRRDFLSLKERGVSCLLETSIGYQRIKYLERISVMGAID